MKWFDVNKIYDHSSKRLNQINIILIKSKNKY